MADETDTGADPTPGPPRPLAANAPVPLGAADREEVDRVADENTVAPVSERSAEAARHQDGEEPSSPPGTLRDAADPQPANANDLERLSVERGDVPDAIKRRYFAEEPQFSPEVRFFTDARNEQPAFRDAGGKLTVRDSSPDIVRDLVAIAEHRGWKAIEVRGEDDFRRAVWLEAKVAGLEVRGYKPTERDLQELARHLDARDVNSVAPAKDLRREAGSAAPPSSPGKAADGPSKPARLDYDKGVTGRLLESGEAPYKHRSGQELTPFVRVEQANGRQIEVWGVGLPAALQRSGAQIGEEITLRRDGVERVTRTFEVRDKASGELTLQQREVPRNRWTIEAERFRSASPAEAARDPALRDAQSRLAVVAAVVKDRHPNPAVQDRLIAGAKEKIAAHIEQGGRFSRANLREPVADRDRPPADRGSARDSGTSTRQPDLNKPAPERTRGR